MLAPLTGGFFTVRIFINMKKIFAFLVGCVAIIILGHYAFHEMLFTKE
jgi:hypothetical protein